MTHPNCIGDQALRFVSACGRFAVYKTEGRERGARGAAPFTLYSVHDAEAGKTTKLRKVREIDSLIHYRLTGERLGAWFNSETPAPKAALVEVVEAA